MFSNSNIISSCKGLLGALVFSIVDEVVTGGGLLACCGSSLSGYLLPRSKASFHSDTSLLQTILQTFCSMLCHCARHAACSVTHGGVLLLWWYGVRVVSVPVLNSRATRPFRAVLSVPELTMAWLRPYSFLNGIEHDLLPAPCAPDTCLVATLWLYLDLPPCAQAGLLLFLTLGFLRLCPNAQPARHAQAQLPASARLY